MAATPRGEKFTEFYILGLEGEAADYPKELLVGQEGKVIIGIINNEYQDLYYYVEIWSAETLIGELDPVLLPHEQKWEGEVSFVPKTVGGDQKVEFLLYKEGQTEVSQSLHLWLDITQ